MAYLTLNGITVSVSVEGGSLAHIGHGGEQERSPSGTLGGGSLVDKREWNLSTTPVPASEVDAWVGLIEGRGHSWSFNTDLYSARGRGPSYSIGAAITASGMKHGAGHVTVGDQEWVAYDVGLPSAWTVLLWRKESGTWRHYVVRSDGEVWLDGVTSAVDPSAFLVVSGGEVQVGDLEPSGLRDFDDVVALPYAVPDSWAPLLYTQHNAAAWSALPRVSAAGTFSTDALTVRGKVKDARSIRYSPSGTLTTGHMLQFTIREV